MAGNLPKKLDPEDIEGDGYKRWFGGKFEEWDRRGSFQLELLKLLGLRPEHKFLDIGCGPVCGGVHVIPYLQPGNYVGVDNHPDLIQIGNRVLKEKKLTAELKQVNAFDFGDIGPFDVAMAFSVPLLNFAEDFFMNITSVMKPGGRVLITHAHNFDDWFVPGLHVTNRYLSASDLGRLDIESWGFLAPHIFPTVELTR